MSITADSFKYIPVLNHPLFDKLYIYIAIHNELKSATATHGNTLEMVIFKNISQKCILIFHALKETV